MEETKLIKLKNISLKFGSNQIHKDISFEVESGETITLLGPSGTGKTLLLKMIMGLITPSSGEVTVMGHRLNDLLEDELRRIRKDIGMLFQGAALFDSLSVYDNIAYSLLERHECDNSEIKDRVAHMLEVVALPGIEKKFPPQLSGGQKKRVGLARALASSPKIMLFDEPTTGLDPTSKRVIDDLIIKLDSELGLTSIVVTHDIDSAKRVSKRWVLIDQGVVVADGEVDDVLNSNKMVSNFVTGQWT